MKIINLMVAPFKSFQGKKETIYAVFFSLNWFRIEKCRK